MSGRPLPLRLRGHLRHPGGAGPAVLLCHGFTGTPQSLGLWAEALAAAGAGVRVPRLPGHGTRWELLNRTAWPDWYHRVERELLVAAEAGDGPVFVGGLSMGGALALRLAQRHPQRVAGLLLVNPCVLLRDPRLHALPLVRRVVPSLPGITNDIARPGMLEDGYPRNPLHALASVLQFIRIVERDLPTVQAPTLIFRSLHDHVVPVASGERVVATIASADVVDVPLVESYHVATLDHELDIITEHSISFLRRLTSDANSGCLESNDEPRTA